MGGKILAVTDNGGVVRVHKAGELLDESWELSIQGRARPYVSRGGEKLVKALDVFEIEVGGKVCADIGISTGGFTHCLLLRGALRVHGVDVGYGQVAWSIRSDPRVTLYERTNARMLGPLAFGEPISLIVVDASFISLALLFPALLRQLESSGEIVALVKPQFELPKAEVPKGVVEDPLARKRAVDSVAASAEALGLWVAGSIESPITGRDGNVEHLILLKRSAS